ncbi:MAG: hypothetical protein HYZ27_04800 [Deltaproteobacteria bacterium]|nr:hypothetical protein [Deltaproteobacteria bacterium]
MTHIDGRQPLAGVDCVAIVPETQSQVLAVVRRVEEVRHDSPLAMVLVSKANLSCAEELVWKHDFDGFVDLDWPSALARSAVRTAIRHVQLGRNVVDIQRAVLEHARHQTASLFEIAAHDDLTGLYNRRHFAELMAREHERSDMAARVGGDEFVAFLADSSEIGAMAFAARLLRRLRTSSFEVDRAVSANAA